MPEANSRGATEQFVAFDCEGETCIGVMHAPRRESVARLGVVVIVGGPQYRVGSHRQFVILARALADAGIPVLRFDVRGMGDSDGEARNFEVIGPDVAAAIDALQQRSGVARVVLWGLCDGASAALMYAAADNRVAGVVALNPWVRSPESEAVVRLRHYYLKRLFSSDFWRKLLRGGFKLRQGTRDLLGSVHDAAAQSAVRAPTHFLTRMEAGWEKLTQPLLLLLSGQDLTAREFELWVSRSRKRRGLMRRPATEVLGFPQADHTFSTRAWRDAVTEKTIQWVRGLP